MAKLLNIVIADLRAALMLLTRLPAWPVKNDAPPDLARSCWAYPIVGTLVGSIGSAAYLLMDWPGASTPVGVLIAITCMVLATGAFHEDGLADTADGLGGGWTRERKLEIMRDSRIGTYGTVAVLVALALRAAAMIEIADLTGAAGLAAGIVVAGTASRGGIVLLLFLMNPARTDGMGTVAQNPPTLSVGIALATCGLVYPLAPGIAVFIAGLFGLAIVYTLGQKQLNGYTGDLLGSGQQVSEIFILISWSMLV